MPYYAANYCPSDHLRESINFNLYLGVFINTFQNYGQIVVKHKILRNLISTFLIDHPQC